MVCVSGSSSLLGRARGRDTLDLPAIMEEFYRWADRYSTLEDNIRTATQTVMIISKPIDSNKPEGKKVSESKEGQSKNRK